MKTFKTLAILIAFTALFIQSKAQLPKQKDNASQVIKSIPNGKTYNLDKADEIETTNKAILKGVEHKVYATRKGKLYIKLVSAKTGKEYRRYLKTE